jgi:hypothetical protein
MFKKIFLTIFFIALSLNSQAYASDDFFYVFHLYSQNGILVVDRDARFPYDLVADTYVQVGNSPTYYKGEVVNFIGGVVGNFAFELKSNQGKIDIEAPYAPDAKEVRMYDSNGVIKLVISVTDSAVCNDDGVCGNESGEGYDNCPLDCAASVPSPYASEEPLSGNSENSSTGGSSKVIPIIFFIILGSGLSWGIWILWKNMKNRNTI